MLCKLLVVTLFSGVVAQDHIRLGGDDGSLSDAIRMANDLFPTGKYVVFDS
jgi:hypothetical protein